MMEELFINLELLPLSKPSSLEHQFLFPGKAQQVFPRKTRLHLEGAKAPQDVFSHRKSLDVAQPFLCVVPDISAGMGSFCVPSWLLLLLTTPGSSVRMALHSAAIVMKLSLIHHLDFTAHKTGGGNGL